MGAELGVGYISIVPEVSKISPGIAKALGDSAAQADPAGRSIGEKLSGGLVTTLKAGALAGGAAAGGVLATAITKGFGRLTGIENAQASLRGLGHDAQSVQTIMDNALASVKGTAFGLQDAAQVAAQVVAAGVKPGQELEQVLKTVGDTAQIAGASMGEMGTIFGSVAARGKLQGDDMLQLMSRGVPVLQLLSAEMGKTSAEISDMVSAGKVDFATFEAAMRRGMGGAALEAGETFKGAAANVGAALGRLGATALTPFFDATKTGMNSATEGIDALNAKIKPTAERLASFITGTVVPGFEQGKAALEGFAKSPEFQSGLGQAKGLLTDFTGLAKELAPTVVNVGSALGQASAALGVSSWDIFVATLKIAGSALHSVAGPLESVSGFLSDHPGLVAAAITAWTGFKTIPGIVDRVASVIGPHKESLAGLASGVSELKDYYAGTGRQISTFGATMQYAATSSNTALAGMATAYTNAANSGESFAKTTGVVAAGMSGMRSAVGGVLNLFGGPWGLAFIAAGAAITSLSLANDRATEAQELLATSASRAASAQVELMAAVAGTTGALNDQATKAAEQFAEAYTAKFLAVGEALDGFISKDPTKTFSERMQMTGYELAKHDQELQATREAYDQLKASGSEFGIKIGDIGKVVAEGGDNYKALIADLRESGEAGVHAADKLEATRAELDRIIEAARRVDPAAAQAAAGIDVLGDSSSSAEDKLKALESVLQAMGLAPKDAEKAMMDAAASVDEIVAKAEEASRPLNELGENLGDIGNGKLDPANASARDLAAGLNELREQLVNVAVNGGDIQGAFDNMQPALDALGREFGLTSEQVAKLAESYGLVPDVIETAVKVEAGSVSAELLEVYAALRPLEEGATVEVSAVSDQALRVLEDLGIKVEETPDGKNIVLTGTNDDALAKLLQTSNEMTRVHEQKVEPKISVDNTAAISGVNKVIAALTSIPATKVVSIVANRIGDWFTGSSSSQPGRAFGGRLPETGPGTDRVDGFLGVDHRGMPIARVDAGEWVINRRSSAKYDRELAAINRGTFPKIPGYVNGGIVTAREIDRYAHGEAVRGAKASRSLEGSPYVFGGVNWGDCSSTAGQLASFAIGKPTTGRVFATGTQRAWADKNGFIRGIGGNGTFTMGWLNGGRGGGHTSVTVRDHSGITRSYEMGGGRGNGQIGGRAASASHPQYTDHAYVPLAKDGGGAPGKGAGAGDFVATSVDGFVTGGGRSVSFGEASNLYEDALKHIKRVGVFDTGGILNHLGLAFNASGRPERILDPDMTVEFEKALKVIPESARSLDKTAKVYEKIAVSEGRTFGGEFISNAGVVRDAEQGLLETRRAVAEELEEVGEKERKLKAAREELRKIEAEGKGGLTKQDRRKIADAEEAVAKARKSGKADKIAAAEKRLARAREDVGDRLEKSSDKNAKAVKAAQEKVNKATDALADAQEKAADQAHRLEAAERAVTASRFVAVQQIIEKVSGGISAGFTRISEFLGEMAKLAEIVERTRQEVSKLQMQQQTNEAARIKSLQDLQLKEMDTQRTRYRGVLAILKAEAEVEKARGLAAKRGSTSIEAMSGAMDRFRRTGVFSVETVAQSVVDNSKEVRAAEWAVKVTRAQTALESLEAAHGQRLAQLAVAEATLTQASAAKLLHAHTEALQQQAQMLYGLSSNQLSGASKGFSGIGQVAGGVGTFFAGLAAAAAGFATAGPLGAIPGVLMAFKGISSIAKGSIDIHTNRKEIGETWGKLGHGERAAIVLGSLGAAGGGIAGALATEKYGPEAAKAGSEVGAAFTELTLGSLEHSIKSRIEKSARDAEDRIKKIQLETDQSSLKLALDQASEKLKHAREKDRLEAELEYAKLQELLVKSDSEREKAALRAAAEIEKSRAAAAATGAEHTEQFRRMNTLLEELVRLSKEPRQAQSTPVSAASSRITGLQYATSKLGG
ncbi:tape measure domain (plasmid) [Corynebacterium mustelae]|uniref:Tape measure domain n=1 Tax=Corynebacterium mustelae TaxID=571915 RepID=A0A0G3H1Y4_9CORY|nr:tape measure protein [Corynebacterium mustelae]AKK05245.1 tape measure domain [Corynebacterium mustelae]AKK07429.1 tape measure domain [Corynebacterium mustelae]